MTKVTEKLGVAIQVAIQYEIPTAIFLEFYDPNNPPKFKEREHAFVPNVQECVAQLAEFPNMKMVLAWPNPNNVNLSVYTSSRKTLCIFRLYMNLYVDFSCVWVEIPTQLILGTPYASKIRDMISRAVDLTQEIVSGSSY